MVAYPLLSSHLSLQQNPFLDKFVNMGPQKFISVLKRTKDWNLQILHVACSTVAR